MSGSFHLGKLAGIDIYINFSLLIGLVLLTTSLASGWFPGLYPGAATSTYILMGIVGAMLLFISILLHELAHSLVARAHGLAVRSIVLFIFGGVSNIEQEAPRPGVEFQVSVVGPLVSILLGALCFLLWLPIHSHPSAVGAVLMVLALINVLLGVFNLIPGFPLDGGRVFRSIVWKITGNANTATRIAATVGQIVAYLFILWGIFQVFGGDVLDGIWIGFVGWFLLSAAQSTRAQSNFDAMFGNVTVEQVMNTQPITVPANISLQKLVDDYFLPQGLRSAFVMQGDWFAGLVTLSDIRHIPRETWAQTPVGQIMIPVARLHAVTPQQSLKEVLPLMATQDVNQLPVVSSDGQLLGVLSRDAIMRSLEVRRKLGLKQ